MLTLRLFLVILATLLCREVCWHADQPVEALRALVAVVAACVAFGAIAKIACIANLKKFGEFSNEPQQASQAHDLTLGLDRWNSIRHSLETLWVLALPLTLIGTAWGPWILQLDAAGLPQSVSLLLWFSPSLAALVILELTCSQMEIYLQNRPALAPEALRFVVTPQYQGIERRGLRIQVCSALPSDPLQQMKPPQLKLGSVFKTRLRLGGTSNVIACLLPVLLIALSSDVLGLLQVEWPESLKSLTASGVGLGAVALFMPHWLSRWMGVEKLKPGELRDRIGSYCKTTGVQATPMWVSSAGRWAGAAMVGWLPGFRQLWLGDALVYQLTAEEVDMVVMHELAHLKRHHFLWRLLPVLFASGIGMSALAVFSDSSGDASNANFIQLSGQFAGMLMASGVMLFGISYGSRRCELDADRHACTLAAAACPWSSGSAERAAGALSQALVKLHQGAGDPDRPTWLHPALRQRLDNLALQPALQRDLQSLRSPELEVNSGHAASLDFSLQQAAGG